MVKTFYPDQMLYYVQLEQLVVHCPQILVSLTGLVMHYVSRHGFPLTVPLTSSPHWAHSLLKTGVRRPTQAYKRLQVTDISPCSGGRKLDWEKSRLFMLIRSLNRFAKYSAAMLPLLRRVAFLERLFGNH